MNSGIPFIKIADRVEVDIDLKAKQLSGPKVTYKE
jgi:multidrug resistance efflux pump